MKEKKVVIFVSRASDTAKRMYPSDINELGQQQVLLARYNPTPHGRCGEEKTRGSVNGVASPFRNALAKPMRYCRIHVNGIITGQLGRLHSFNKTPTRRLHKMVSTLSECGPVHLPTIGKCACVDSLP